MRPVARHPHPCHTHATRTPRRAAPRHAAPPHTSLSNRLQACRAAAATERKQERQLYAAMLSGTSGERDE